MTKYDLREIDADFIRELRDSGQHEEANIALRAYYDDLKKTKKNAGFNYDRMIRRVKKTLKVCIGTNCNRDAEEGRALCRRCMDYKIKYNKSSNCIVCGKPCMREHCQKHAPHFSPQRDKFNRLLEGFNKSVFTFKELNSIFRMEFERSLTENFDNYISKNKKMTRIGNRLYKFEKEVGKDEKCSTEDKGH